MPCAIYSLAFLAFPDAEKSEITYVAHKQKKDFNALCFFSHQSNIKSDILRGNGQRNAL